MKTSMLCASHAQRRLLVTASTRMELARKAPSRKKKADKPTNPRADFLSKMMRQLSGDRGDLVTKTFFGKDRDRFYEAMMMVAKNLARQMPNVER